MIKQRVQPNLNQQLAMTPQLQQAIRFLQLSALELQQEIQLALENNPLLEQSDPFTETEQPTHIDSTDQWELPEAFAQQSMPTELPLDTDWDSIYPTEFSATTHHHYVDHDEPVYQAETTQTLREHLLWQVELADFSEIESTIATLIIDAIDDNGYLAISLSDIFENLSDDRITLSQVESVLKQIHCFDPAGVGARDLSECLFIQLSQLSPNTPYLAEAQQLTQHYLDLIGSHNFSTLIKQSRFSEKTIRLALKLIKTLNPRPGHAFTKAITTYVTPDVLTRKVHNEWMVELNPAALPRLHINQRYAALDGVIHSRSANQFIRRHLQDAKWLIKNLQNRHDTLLKVARCIVQRQQTFFEQGEEQMKPMVLADIAQALTLHESTISRATTQKYLHSPRGIFELKYFFSSHITTDDGSEISATAIRALIKKLMVQENPAKPLSDSKLRELLANQGIIVARRTVAKYREFLSIPPSYQRKQPP